MIVGDSSYWDDVFQQNLLPLILNFVIAVWNQMPAPKPDDLEDDISDQLFCSLLNSKDKSNHPFLIRREDREYDPSVCKQTGRKYIVFFPSHDEDIYLCIEAKRLNAIISGKFNSLAGQYVQEGMQRFVNRKYAAHVLHGAMLGYVLDGKISKAMKSVENKIREHFSELGMENDCCFIQSTIRPDDHHTKETRHKRSAKPEPFSIHHLFVAGEKN